MLQSIKGGMFAVPELPPHFANKWNTHPFSTMVSLPVKQKQNKLFTHFLSISLQRWKSLQFTLVFSWSCRSFRLPIYGLPLWQWTRKMIDRQQKHQRLSDWLNTLFDCHNLRAVIFQWYSGIISFLLQHLSWKFSLNSNSSLTFGQS